MERKDSLTIEPKRQTTGINDFVGDVLARTSRQYEKIARKQKGEYEEHMKPYMKRGERTVDNVLYHTAFIPSPNLRHNFYANDFRSKGVFDKPTVFSIGCQEKPGYFTLEKSPKYTISDKPRTRLGYELYQNKLCEYLYLTKLREYLYLTNVSEYLYLNKLRDYLYIDRLREEYPDKQFKFNKHCPKLLQRSEFITNQSLKNLKSCPQNKRIKTHIRSVDATKHNFMTKKPTRIEMFQEKKYTQSSKKSAKGVDSVNKLEAYKEPWSKLIAYKKNKNRVRHEIENPHNFPNAKSNITTKTSLGNNVTCEENTSNLIGRNNKSGAFLMEDSNRYRHNHTSDFKMSTAKLKEFKEKQLKFNEENGFSQITVFQVADETEDSNFHHNLVVRASLNPSDAAPHHLNSLESVGVNRYQVKKDTGSKNYLSKKLVLQDVPGSSKNLEGKKIKYEEDQHILKCRQSVSGDETWYYIDPYSSKGQIPLETDRRHHCLTFEETIEVVDDSQLATRKSSTPGLSKDNSPRKIKEYQEQEMNLDEDHREKTRSDSILTADDRPTVRSRRISSRIAKIQEASTAIDKYNLIGTNRVLVPNRDAESGESSHVLMIHSKQPRCEKHLRLSKRIDNIWSHLCSNGKYVGTIFMILCMILGFKQLC